MLSKTQGENDGRNNILMIANRWSMLLFIFDLFCETGTSKEMLNLV